MRQKLIKLIAMGSSFFFLAFVILPSHLEAQSTPSPIESDVEYGSGTMEEYTQIETQLGQGLPTILEGITQAGNQVKQNDFESAQATLQKALQEARSNEKILGEESQYKEVSDYMDKMEAALTAADGAITARKKVAALQNLTQAYRYAKTISDSPVLKLAASEIALGQASRMIRQGDYSSAGLFLERAIDNVVAVQQDPRLQGQEAELNKLKNAMLVTKLQVVNGQLKDEKRLNNFYPGLAAARVNTFNTYYSVFNSGSMPWDLY